MAKRKHPARRKGSTRARKPPVPPTPPASTPALPSPLLALPAEIRCMIWKAVVDTPILLREAGWTEDGLHLVNAISSSVLGPEFIESECLHHHEEQQHNTKAPGPLSWLRTNQQIYNEAEPIVYRHLSLHICCSMVFEALLSDRLPESNLKREELRSLSLCLRITIEHDMRDGYTFATRVTHDQIHGFGGWSSLITCRCSWCCARRRFPQDGPSLDKCFPKLEEVRLRVYFVCRQGQGNCRPVIGHDENGRNCYGSLYRPDNPSPLVWRGNEQSLEELVRDLCREQTLGMFKGGRPKSLQVDFATQSIQHTPGNECSHREDRCWCEGRSIDLESLPKTLLTSALQTHLSMT